MKAKYSLFIAFLFSLLIGQSQNVVIIIIDGARYTETFGDPNKTYIPNMADLALQGSYCDEFYNQHQTYTSQAIPALWSGSWAGTQDTVYQGNSTQYSLAPSIFEYFRKQKDLPASESYYVLKYVSSLWLQSFHSEYGPDYWPTTISSGSTDNDVLTNTIDVIENEQPQLLWVYLADVDHEGHSGIWNNYVSAIQNADLIVKTIWDKLQSESHYADNTVLFVTNDHGRHDDQHGGFSGHGCSCEGCRHIMFLALGPNIKENYISTQTYEIADAAVTASEILNIDPVYSTGEVAEDIFQTIDIFEPKSEFDLYATEAHIYFNLEEQNNVRWEIYNLQGQIIESNVLNNLSSGKNKIQFNQNLSEGIYIFKFQANNKTETLKFHKYRQN